MDIGVAVKTLRKKKGYSQKDFAEAAGLSVNGLCLIEMNKTFPQRATIKTICEALNIPISYLLFFSISDDDVPQENRRIFKALSSQIKDVLVQDITDAKVE